MPLLREVFSRGKEGKVAVYKLFVGLFSFLLLKHYSEAADNISLPLFRHTTLPPRITPRNSTWQKAVVSCLVDIQSALSGFRKWELPGQVQLSFLNSVPVPVPVG